MNARRPPGLILAAAVGGGLAVMVSGCAWFGDAFPRYTDVTITASEQANPDDSGRPSPVALKVYELKRRDTFDNLDFDAAFDNADVVLSDELLASAEFMLQPGESVTHRIDLDDDGAYVGVVAAYRQIDDARWRLVNPVEGNWSEQNVRVGRTGLALERRADEDDA
ncbi:type VI secretion system lipoprotein TssJ [Aquisalimonas sp. 2447]|uniref:type VI secretion system lipoprotein TssJ n=1 Tax=Aquisalimonas sp. 2447 TaxID=2740807 RepID=UPI00143251FB|nr:type VI secretion system lipoprotein TssJ [Aquisalimonas sp. 2447]QIT55815.1 type VI secretion system lipoprotein TssJ [Aquisalimonas sp. 2447]